MIACNEFIPFYSEICKFLHRRGGKAAVVQFWNYFADTFLTGLKCKVEQDGIRGCWQFWADQLEKGNGDFHLEMDEKAGEFRVSMKRCSAMSQLLASPQLKPYPDYCDHCRIEYGRILGPLGYEVVVDHSRSDRGRCNILVRRMDPAVAKAASKAKTASKRPARRAARA
jgi:hypothetical protein